MNTTPLQANRLFINLMDDAPRSVRTHVHPDGWTFRTRKGAVHYLAKEDQIVTSGHLDKWHRQYVNRALMRPVNTPPLPFEDAPSRAPRWA